MEFKFWNEDIKKLRSIILQPDKLEESINLCLGLHAMVHSSLMSGINTKTFEDELWEGLDEHTFRSAVNSKGRTVAYGIWHSTRIEDITMNLLVADEDETFDTGNFKEKISANCIDTGNAMDAEEILAFSKDINMQELRNYRMIVGRKTRAIIKNLSPSDMKRKVSKENLQLILNKGSVLNVDSANWLIDFWGRKNVAGLLLMPATRHHLVHINESLHAKNKAVK